MLLWLYEAGERKKNNNIDCMMRCAVEKNPPVATRKSINIVRTRSQIQTDKVILNYLHKPAISIVLQLTDELATLQPKTDRKSQLPHDTKSSTTR